jgi:hypothetical protein
MRVRRALLLAVLLATGCAGGGEEPESAPAPTSPAPVTTAEAAAPADPGAALDAFIEAAAATDTKAMWSRLTARSRERLGPSLAAFRAGAGARLAERLASLASANAGQVLSEQITLDVGVAAVAGPGAAFAAATRLEDGEWLLELGSPIRIRPILPDPGETVDERTQVAAEFRAPSAILEAGLWVDGRAVPARSGGVSPSYVTIFSEVGHLQLGSHSTVAFVLTDEDAGALAWPFRAAPGAPTS